MKDGASLDNIIDDETDNEEDTELIPLEQEELEYWQEVFYNEFISEEEHPVAS